MIDLESISTEVRLARGDYATVRAAHEDAKKALQIQCGKLSSIASKVLRNMQPDEGQEAADVVQLIADGRKTLDEIEATCGRTESLAGQREELRGKAWPK